ncbi:hypothetical protein QFZ47_000308 [Variovorax paradoxus]|nr:hypothetical protein [Variovorax paradoxus]
MLYNNIQESICDATGFQAPHRSAKSKVTFFTYLPARNR